MSDTGGPDREDALAGLEQQGWQALSSTPERAAQFYERILDHAVMMLLPGGLVLDDRQAIISAMSGQPWSSFRLDDVKVRHLTPDTAMLTYGVTADRAGATYTALVSSTYVRRADGWRMAFHQQTPR